MIKCIGIIKPDLKMNGIFYENTIIVSKPVIALLIDEESTTKQIRIQPFCFFRDKGEILPANSFDSYLGLEEEDHKKDWSKEVDEFKARQKKPLLGGNRRNRGKGRKKKG